MAITAAQLQIVVTANTAEAESNLAAVGDTAEEAGGGVQGLLGNMLGMAGGVLVAQVAAQGFQFLKDQISETFTAGMDANRMTAQLTAGLRSTHDASGQTTQSLAALAEQLMSATGIQYGAVQSAESMLLTFTNIGKSVFPQATQAVADLATKMAGGAVPSAQQMQDAALQLGKALNDPTKGITALTREGVTFTTQQKDQIATMMAAGNTAGAQAVILKEMQKEFGGSADAAGHANGSMAIFTAQMDDAREKIGQSLIPVVMSLTSLLMPLAMAFAQHLPGAISATIATIQNVTHFFASASPAADAVKLGLIALAGAFTAVGTAMLVGAIPGIITAATAWGVEAGAAALAAIATLAAAAPFLLVGAAVALLIVGIYELVTHWSQVSAWLQGAWAAVIAGVGAGFSWLGTQAHDLWTDITQAFTDGINWFDSLPGRIASAIQTNIVTPLKNEITGVIDLAESWGTKLIQMFLQGIEGQIDAVKNAVGNLMSGVKNLMGFHSPTAEGPGSDADTWGPNLGKMFASGLLTQQGDVASAATTLMSRVKGALAGQSAITVGTAGAAGLMGGGSPNMASGLMASPATAQANQANATAQALAGVLSGASVGGQPVVLQLDGLRLGSALLPYIGKAARMNTGIRTN